MLLFITSILENDWERIYMLSFTLGIFYTCVLLAILIDLWSGVEKARRGGIYRTSYGLRRTINKIKDYFSVLILFTICDVVASLWFTLPFFTAIGTIGMVIIEAKSVYENKKHLNKGIKDLPMVLSQLLKNKDDISEIINILNDNSRTTAKDIPPIDEGE